ncbi:hypothetical protein GNZ12_24140 [Paraburkholderia sp. 1N]|uniref:Uncharacterized protein n=1 Tax=Paraburkholderia solitsugae TaxID=2675748 RepID=A0ABX2BUD8_9BURK|nr:hypothetical protein [Paraburkholderia solitsugae]NPT44344.1 hypothetical protein [Paraburkholderia solitsugae]
MTEKLTLLDYAAACMRRELLDTNCLAEDADRAHAKLLELRGWCKRMERRSRRYTQFGRFRIIYFRRVQNRL